MGYHFIRYTGWGIDQLDSAYDEIYVPLMQHFMEAGTRPPPCVTLEYDRPDTHPYRQSILVWTSAYPFTETERRTIWTFLPHGTTVHDAGWRM
ncbi:hypothetical protein IAT38_000040 [Cryptococcus sp. DSM 104549]